MRGLWSDVLWSDVQYKKVHFLFFRTKAFSFSRKLAPEEAVRATLSLLRDEVTRNIDTIALSAEDPESERRRKLE